MLLPAGAGCCMVAADSGNCPICRKSHLGGHARGLCSRGGAVETELDGAANGIYKKSRLVPEHFDGLIDGLLD